MLLPSNLFKLRMSIGEDYRHTPGLYFAGEGTTRLACVTNRRAMIVVSWNDEKLEKPESGVILPHAHQALRRMSKAIGALAVNVLPTESGLLCTLRSKESSLRLSAPLPTKPPPPWRALLDSAEKCQKPIAPGTLIDTDLLEGVLADMRTLGVDALSFDSQQDGKDNGGGAVLCNGWFKWADAQGRQVQPALVRVLLMPIADEGEPDGTRYLEPFQVLWGVPPIPRWVTFMDALAGDWIRVQELVMPAGSKQGRRTGRILVTKADSIMTAEVRQRVREHAAALTGSRPLIWESDGAEANDAPLPVPLNTRPGKESNGHGQDGGEFAPRTAGDPRQQPAGDGAGASDAQHPGGTTPGAGHDVGTGGAGDGG